MAKSFAVGILVPRLHKLRHFHGVILHRRAMQELYEIWKRTCLASIQFVKSFFFVFFLAALFLPLLKRIKRTIFTAKDPELNPYRPLADLRSLVSHTFSRLRDALYEALIMRVCSRAIFSWKWLRADGKKFTFCGATKECRAGEVQLVGERGRTPKDVMWFDKMEISGSVFFSFTLFAHLLFAVKIIF